MSELYQEQSDCRLNVSAGRKESLPDYYVRRFGETEQGRLIDYGITDYNRFFGVYKSANGDVSARITVLRLNSTGKNDVSFLSFSEFDLPRGMERFFSRVPAHVLDKLTPIEHPSAQSWREAVEQHQTRIANRKRMQILYAPEGLDIFSDRKPRHYFLVPNLASHFAQTINGNGTIISREIQRTLFSPDIQPFRHDPERLPYFKEMVSPSTDIGITPFKAANEQIYTVAFRRNEPEDMTPDRLLLAFTRENDAHKYMFRWAVEHNKAFGHPDPRPGREVYTNVAVRKEVFDELKALRQERYRQRQA